jgi:hypothetical protein
LHGVAAGLVFQAPQGGGGFNLLLGEQGGLGGIRALMGPREALGMEVLDEIGLRVGKGEGRE